MKRIFLSIALLISVFAANKAQAKDAVKYYVILTSCGTEYAFQGTVSDAALVDIIEYYEKRDCGD